MTTTQAAPAPGLQTTTIKVQTMIPGWRYWGAWPGCESAWTVESVTIEEASFQVDRTGHVFSPVLVTIKLRNGMTQVCEYDDDIAIQGPWKTEA